MSDPVLQLRDVSKRYRTYPTPMRRLVDLLSPGPLRFGRVHWALRGISFGVDRGESIGVIGRNGAGKSTLLKILVGTTRASSGEVVISGRVSGLLELGLGFHPQFLGRENAVAGCQMLGMSSDAISTLLPEILEFSELGDYFDEPLRTYSSGMHLRLAFSVATAQRPEVLVVDESLAVGDAYFQQKCIQRIRDFQSAGTSILLVSHDLSTIKTLCSRVMLMEQGEIVFEGLPVEVVDYYNASIATQQKDYEIRQLENERGEPMTRSGNKRATIREVTLCDEQGREVRAFVTGSTIRVRAVIGYREQIENCTVGLLLKDRLGIHVYGTNTFLLQTPLDPQPRSSLEVVFEFQANLGPGTYTLSIASHTGATHHADNHDWWDNSASFEILPSASRPFVGIADLKATASATGFDTHLDGS